MAPSGVDCSGVFATAMAQAGWAGLAGLALLFCVAASEDDWSQCRPPCKCKWLSGRKAADCANSSLSAVPSGLSKQIQWLDISNNRIPILPGEAFRSVGLVNLQKAYLKECEIEDLHKDAFNGLEILIELDLSGNKIKTLHPGVFINNIKLRILILNRNPIQKIADRVFTNLSFLQTVEINDCQIAQISHKAFVNVSNLLTLRLAGNNLTNMKPDTLKAMDNLKSLELHNNPWRCDCHLKTFWEWIMTKNLYAQPTACLEPELLKNRLWSELDGNSLACKPEISVTPKDGVKVEGGVAVLGCLVKGDPNPDVHWVYKSQMLSNKTRRNVNEFVYMVRDIYEATGRWVNLTVMDVRLSDEGEYMCVARNPGGVAEAKLRLEVVGAGSRAGGMLGGTISDAWPLILGLVSGMVVLLVIVVVLVFCYCRTKDPRTNNNNKKAMGEGVSSNGDLSYHSGPGSEQEKSLITVVNPVQKPPRRYETLSTSTPNEFEMRATLLDNGSVITGPSVAECEDALLQDRSLESLENVPARSRETIDAECGVRSAGGANLPPDLLSFPSRGNQVSPAGSSASTAPDSSRLPAQHGPQSPVRSPLYHPAPYLFGTLPYSRSQSPFSPALSTTPVVMPRQGYVTIPRRPRVPSWSSPQPAPILVLDPLTAKLEPVYDNLGPRTTADGSSVLSLNKAGETPAPAPGSGMRGRPLPLPPASTPTLQQGLPPFYSPIAPIAEQPSPALARATLAKQRSNPNLSNVALGSPELHSSFFGGGGERDATPVSKRSSIASVTSGGVVSPVNGTSPDSRPASAASVKVPPKPPPKPKKKTSDTVAGPLYEDEGEDGTEV